MVWIIIWIIGIAPSAAWFMWLDRKSAYPSPAGDLLIGLGWPITVPLALVFVGTKKLSAWMWEKVTGRQWYY